MKPSRKTRHRAEHLPGIHNQAWSPNDDFYPMWVGGRGGDQIQGKLTALRTESGGPYAGLKIATITIEVSPCKRDIIGDSVDVVDHSGCVFDLPEAELIDVWVWASEGIAKDKSVPTENTPCHWTANDRCCV